MAGVQVLEDANHTRGPAPDPQEETAIQSISIDAQLTGEIGHHHHRPAEHPDFRSGSEPASGF